MRSICYSCVEGENLGDWDYEDWVCCRCHRDERLPEGESCEFYKKRQLPPTLKIKVLEEIVEELKSCKDHGAEYIQAMENIIIILKTKYGIDEEKSNNE